MLQVFSQSQSNLNHRGDALENVSNKSENMPKISGGDLKGIMVHHETRTHVDQSGGNLPT